MRDEGLQGRILGSLKGCDGVAAFGDIETSEDSIIKWFTEIPIRINGHLYNSLRISRWVGVFSLSRRERAGVRAA
jgi:hypothetical protein